MNDAAPAPLSLLRSGHIGQLHTFLNGRQGQFEAGEIGERDLLSAFQPFDSSDLTLAEGFRSWLSEHPDAYAPHVAMAAWFLGRGWEARGHMTSNLVSDQGWRALQHFLAQADAFAHRATTLTANPLVAATILGRVSGTRGCDLTLDDVQRQAYPEWFTRGVHDNPGSYTLRRLMLLNLRAEWGGSEEHMLTFVRQQQEARLLSDMDVQRLWAEFHSHVSHHALHFANDPVLGVERARLAADLHPAQSEQLFIALSHARAVTAERLEALRRFLTAAEQDDTITPHGNFAWALHNSGDWALPETPRIGALLTRAAGAGDPDAAVMLGRLQLTHPNWRLPDALPLLKAARDQGHTEAAETIVYLRGLVTHPTESDAAQKRDDILQAANLMSGEMSWEVYRQYDDYERQFALEPRQKYRYLHRAADAGDNDARLELAQQLRAGNVELGEDDVLRPVDTAPLQGSLDYAKHLLERAAGSGHAASGKVLKKTSDRDWQAATARRPALRPMSHVPAPARSGFRLSWWHWLAGIAVVRLIASLFGHQW
ncbi:hypothetical protein HNQ07_000301 [Deinococcus metalli]|uniref:DUF4034 domain-containing protein n=1 Tax=Deinococcus metalli TaxID=1141878 RepID=A0A7W8NQ81_9DEIO|nr:DUF4034 domain-containing protein [Deinococcus metalli]MBB5374857.1 hypothetical protein [Deinococcus metalli]GHF33175.1 hypothetical protein GCM10017781_07410 [Deinococcus metalli]